MKYKIEKGDKFLCIQDYLMEDDELAYTKGNIYTSDMNGCITDNENCVKHIMNFLEDFFEHFKPLKP